MSDSLSGYYLRRGYSPHRNSSRRRSSKSYRNKQDLPEEAQEETDSIYVATYNDNPEHLYGKVVFCLYYSSFFNLALESSPDIVLSEVFCYP